MKLLKFGEKLQKTALFLQKLAFKCGVVPPVPSDTVWLHPLFDGTAGLDDVLYALYSSEINVSIHCFWDAGWTVQIGDAMNGFKDTAYFDNNEMSDIAGWLAKAAYLRYPNSDYAKDIRCQMAGCTGRVYDHSADLNKMVP